MPDIRNKADYTEYEQSVAEFIAREELSALSTGCDEDMLPEDEGGNVDPWFSRRPCECCGSHLGGDREYLFARQGEEIVNFVICEDCVYYVNYGRLDDATMQRLETTSEVL